MLPRTIVSGLFLVIATGVARAQLSSGDTNCDGVLNGLDVAPFVDCLLTGNCHSCAQLSPSDVNCDGRADYLDINPFVNCLLTGNCPPLCLPEGMVLIPAGMFQMGDSFNEGSSLELPVHAVYVDAFYMDAHHVTSQQYAEYLNWAWSQGGLINVYHDAGGDWVNLGESTYYKYCLTNRADLGTGITWDGSTFGLVAGWENHPMVWVTWWGAVAYSNWRSAMEGRQPSYNNSVTGPTWECNFAANGFRLPTEAEWEKAARGGAAGHRFPWSDTDDIQHARANYVSSAAYPFDTSPTRGCHPAFGCFTNPVDYFAPNGYGLHDMAGNVLQWVNDTVLVNYYGISPYNNPHGPLDPNGFRWVRGGDFTDNASVTRCAARAYYGYPIARNNALGFRLVLHENPVFPGLKGDVNLDGRLNGLDIQVFLDVLLGWTTDPAKVFAADLDGSGAVAIEDAALLVYALFAEP